MCGPRLSGLIVDQLLCVAVVCSDEHLSANLKERVNDSSDTVVYCFDRLDGCLFHSGMSDHVGICEVGDDNVILAGLDRLYETVADFRSAHLRLKVVGGNLRALDKDAVLARIRLFNAAVEEEGDMRILLGLGNTCLSHVVLCEEFAEGLCDLNLRECDLLVRDRYVIIGEACIEDLLSRSSVKLIEIIDAEAAGDLSCTVRTEVEENDGVAILDGGDRLAVFHDYSRNHEFVSDALLIGILDCLHAGGCRNAFAEGERSVCFLYALPAVVTVHSVISSGDHAELAYADLIHLILQLLREISAALGRSVAAVKESMYKDLVQSVPLCHLKQSVHMGIVAVNTAVGQQAVHMQLAVVLLNVFHSLHKDFIFKEISVLDRLGDTGQILINDAACAHVKMSDLGVAHLSVRKTDIQSAGLSLHERVLFHKTVHDRRGSLCHCIVVLPRIQSVAVEDH